VRKDWSPGQISGHLRKKENIRVSHETIYKWIREDKKAGGVLQELSTRQIEADTAQAE
jgi:IS30 family transposase